MKCLMSEVTPTVGKFSSGKKGIEKESWTRHERFFYDSSKAGQSGYANDQPSSLPHYEKEVKEKGGKEEGRGRER